MRSYLRHLWLKKKNLKLKLKLSFQFGSDLVLKFPFLKLIAVTSG